MAYFVPVLPWRGSARLRGNFMAYFVPALLRTGFARPGGDFSVYFAPTLLLLCSGQALQGREAISGLTLLWEAASNFA